ncbi:WD40 repeat-like protein [Schizopora paradoxa]|uniref:WD40 repeat-like protein n=1 Tax=Schizopora paradoxa TaxID=27342 RepID=A0A0H2RKZ9_9AGAM|nr:WD40 repeat-like protein [Schizopora paradoxa]
MVPLIQITADEVNQIIYSYLQDSGFEHTAFTLRVEGRLEQSPHFNDYIPRGQLVELLTKALLYSEVETHCKGDSLITDCRTPFALLKKHDCDISDAMEGVVNGDGEEARNKAPSTAVKRKAAIPAEGDGQERRLKRSAEPETNGTINHQASTISRVVTPSQNTDPVPMDIVPNNSEAQWKSRQTTQGAGDGSTLDVALTLRGHTSEIFACAFNPVYPRILVTGGKDSTIRIWELPEASDDGSSFSEPISKPPIVLRIQNKGEVDGTDITSLAWNPQGTLVAVGGFDSVLRIWTKSGDEYMTNPQHRGSIFRVRFSKTGQFLLTASLDGTTCVWEVATKTLAMQYRCHSTCCLDADWMDEDQFACCGGDGNAYLLQPVKPRDDEKVPIHLGKIRDPMTMRTLKGHSDEVNIVIFNPSKTRLATGSDDFTARIWDVTAKPERVTASTTKGGSQVEQQTESLVLKGHTKAICSVKWCPKVLDGRNEMLATGSSDGTIRLWDSVTGESLQIRGDHKGPVYAIEFSPDARFIASVSKDGWLYVYSVPTLKLVWSWYSGDFRRIIYDLDWQMSDKYNRISLCLGTYNVVVLDINRVPTLRNFSG